MQLIEAIKQSSRYLKIVVLLCVIVIFQIFTFSETIRKYLFPKMLPNIDFKETILNVSMFLVNSSKCQIPSLTAFNSQALPFYKKEEYTSCNRVDMLTYITKTEDVATLRINKDVISSYTLFEPHCCFSIITRGFSIITPDDVIDVGNCLPFYVSVELPAETEIIKVQCRDMFFGKIYENVHPIITMKRKLRIKLSETRIKSPTKPFSVLFVGIDSISRLNLIRALPKTHNFLVKNNWLSLKGYNKVADNTFPNLMAILSGYNESRADSLCNPKELGQLDTCDMLWYEFRRLGYVTGYAEDECSISTFNYRRKGFTKPPTDYYFRPYMLASETLLKIVEKDSMTYCTGPETSGERILNVAKDFATTFKGRPNFGLFWMNTFSHSELMAPTGMDDKIRAFLQDITDSGVLEESFVVFLSDHGIRFGEIRCTLTGWLEERLPFIYISIPERFQKMFPKEISHFRDSEHKLTNPYDIHMSLQHILALSGFNRTSRPSEACPKCQSLFSPVPEERSCEEAGIELHWCTCVGYTSNDKTSPVIKSAADFIVGEIHEIITSRKGEAKCAKFRIKKLIAASVSEHLSYSNATYYLLVFETKPKAVFEATVLYDSSAKENGTFQLQGGVSRLDVYSTHSKCIEDAYLKKYCYCR